MSHNKGKGKCYRWLEEHVTYRKPECLIWPFSTVRGYGSLSHNAKRLYAHRVMCEMVNGPAPSPKHLAAHWCGRGDLGCVHPMHIQWKLPAENQEDRKLHGTAYRGRLTYNAITREQRDQILELAKSKTHDEIAPLFGITRRAVSYIVKGETWKENRKLRRPLTDEQVGIIRSIDRSTPAQVVADMLGIDRGRVYVVRNGRGFRHVRTS